MTQRGRIMIVTLDDGSATLEVTVFGELYEANRRIFREDEFLVVQGKISDDRFTGGLRISADAVLDIVGARIQFGKKVGFSLQQPVGMDTIQEVLAPHASSTGLPLFVRYRAKDVECEMRLGDQWRVLPDDGLKQLLISSVKATDVLVEY